MRYCAHGFSSSGQEAAKVAVSSLLFLHLALFDEAVGWWVGVCIHTGAPLRAVLVGTFDCFLACLFVRSLSRRIIMFLLPHCLLLMHELGFKGARLLFLSSVVSLP